MRTEKEIIDTLNKLRQEGTRRGFTETGLAVLKTLKWVLDDEAGDSILAA